MNKIVLLVLILIVIMIFYKSVEKFDNQAGLNYPTDGYRSNPNYSIYTYPAGYFDYLPGSIGVPNIKSQSNIESQSNVESQPNVESQCEAIGDDYNACYANPKCTIWFNPDGSTHCTKKFLQENI
jgi:hypothetical protein